MRFAKTPLILAVGLVLTWWGISVTRSSAPAKPAEEFDSGVGARREAAANLKAATATRVPAAIPPAGPAAATKPAGAKPVPFEFQKELNDYAFLKTKVMPTEEEKTAKAALLRDTRFLRVLGLRMMRAPMLPIGEQDAAIDLLVDALQNGDKGTADAVIGAIIEDKQVEDASLPAEHREQLAGIKAELLYHWTALEPAHSGQVAGMLPGPVSKRIWNNVREAQEHNLAESAAESGR